jgi:glutathione S-transferase
MSVALYELANAQGHCTSPFVWRIKLALQMKGVPYRGIPVGFLEIPNVGVASYGVGAFKTVPIVEYQGHYLNESWVIAEWLDSTFSDVPRLFSSPAELAMVKFFDKWFGTAIMPPLFRACVYEIFSQVRPEEQTYFRTTRERTFGQTLETVAAGSAAYISRAREALLPMRLALRRAPYLGGEQPNYADHIAWGTFIGFGIIAKHAFLPHDDSLAGWIERGLALAAASGAVDRAQLTILENPL